MALIWEDKEVKFDIPYTAFVSSKLYRELKLRGAVVYNKQLKILPLEQVFSTIHGVWNLSSDQGSLGTLIVTNVRLVWFADMNEAFNVSLPYLQIESIKIRDSKFGNALVVISSEGSGGYILGFRVDPDEKLNTLYKELVSLYSVYTNNPTFGVEYKWLNKQIENPTEKIIDDLEEISEPKNEMTNALSVYLADEGHSKDRPPVYSHDLGLAVEMVKDGFTLQKLWEVLPS
ncbi:unnamed protein product [Brassicogethes aeneus]|uniref:BBSome complex member BBS5 PH domain-containing protein n=1 Tax=Brassicogethes aeneus TaxID=1431903 RepID=A0A9P0BG69_BRAAE|nr:unnamed protein product [Brassicogethes aeneus]